MKAQDLMSRPVVAAARTTTARDLAIQMLLGGFSGMPITDRDGSLAGIVTELDVIHAIRAGRVESATAEEIMTREVISVDVNTSVDDVMRIFEEEKIRRVPVTRKGKLAGLISRPDILRALVEPNFMTFE